MKLKLMKYIALVGVLCAAFTLQIALGGMISVSATDSDGHPVAATANFTFSAGTLSLTLSNDIANTAWISPGQSLSDFTFTLSNGTTSGGSLTSITGTAINIDADGNVTPGTPVSSTDWGLSANSSSTFLLTALIGGQPDYMIAPSGASFPNVNMGVDNFNPYLLTGPVTFTITGDFTADTTISGATFSFGTAPETFVSTPDSGTTAAFLGLAMIGLAAFRTKFRRA